MSNATALAAAEPTNGLIEHVSDQVANEERLFELAQRKAQIYARSSLVPKEYQGNVGNVLIAENMARRMGADTLMVMQNLYVVHGRPGWSAVFLISCFNTCGRFSAIKYRFDGEGDEFGCTAYCTEIATGEVVEGTKITWALVKGEGWSSKAGSKWKTMPDQMFRYRAATFLIRATAPEIGMGLLTRDEITDMAGTSREDHTAPVAGIAGLKDRLIQTSDADAITIDVESETLAADELADKRLELNEYLSLKFEGDIDLIDKFLDGRDVDALDADGLAKLKEELSAA